MSKKTRPEPELAPPLDKTLRTQALAVPITYEMKRFDIFLIDTGWNVGVSKLVRSHLPLMYEYHRQDSLYILTPEQSVALLRLAPEVIGRDPIVIVYDQFATDQSKSGKFRGFRLCLGLMRKPEQALLRLHEFVRFIALHRTAKHLDREISRELHREGFDGMVKILREASTELL
jgi:hypothetical protein